MQEQKPTTLEMAKFPKILGSLMHSNQFMKTTAFAMSVLLVLTLILLFISVTKDPVVLTFNSKSQLLEPNGRPNVEDDVRSAISNYLKLRYQWEPESVEVNLFAAKSFINSNNLDLFVGATKPIIKFSKERLVSQSAYANKIEINLTKQTAFIAGDRITSIQGLKAAANLRLELSFNYGNRTRTNPWGIYITKEKEE